MSVLASGLLAANQDLNISQTVGFAIIGLVMVVAALRVVTTSNVVHAAMWLVLVLAGAAAQYVLLAAEFVAVTQVMVYIGAVIVLFLFGVMLTRAKIGQDSDMTRSNAWVGAVVATGLFAVLTFSLVDTFDDTKLPEQREIAIVSVDANEEPGSVFGKPSNAAAVSDSIFHDYLLPFEIVSVLLTAALIGAIVIARKD